MTYKTGELAASDHFPVEAAFVCNHTSTIKPIRKRSYNKLKFDEVTQQLTAIQLDPDPNCPPDSLIDSWYQSVTAILDRLAPLKNLPRRKKKANWMNPDILELIRHRDFLASKMRGSGTNEDELKVMRKRVKSNIRMAVKSQGTRMLQEKDTRSAWKFIRDMTFTTTKGPRTCMDLHTLNEAFAATVKSNSAAPLDVIPSCDASTAFNIQTLQVTEVTRKLWSINIHTAAGPDELPAALLKRFKDAISPCITRVMNASICMNTFPTSWKLANVAPIWKNKGSRTDAANYRPISVLPVLGRVFEKLSARQLSAHCEIQDIIPTQQFGFRGHSSSGEQALVSAANSWMGKSGCG